jgi:hypothetical protein
MQSGQPTIANNLLTDELPHFMELPVELHMLILEELKTNPLGVINFYITCLSSKHAWMEQKTRPYFFHALNHLATCQFLEVRKLFNFTKRTDKEASAYYQLRHLTQHSKDIGLFICYAFFTDDIRTLGIERVKKALAWIREEYPTYINAIDNLKGILTALVYERDYDLITKSHMEVAEWKPDDITAGDIYPIRRAFTLFLDDLYQHPPLLVHQFPAAINFSTTRGSYHNLASAYLADAHISGNMMYFKRTILWNCYLPNISAENNYFFIEANFGNTFIIKRTKRGNKLSHLDGMTASAIDIRYGLVIDLATLGQHQFIQLIISNTLSLDQFILDFRINPENLAHIESTLETFHLLQTLYDYNHVTLMREVFVDAVLAALRTLVNNGETKQAESLYRLALNHACFQPRDNDLVGVGVRFFARGYRGLSRSQITLQTEYARMSETAKYTLSRLEAFL